MKLKVMMVIIACAIMVANTAHAADKAVTNEAELSYLDTKGNTETITFKAKNTLNWAISDKTDLAWEVGGLYGESDGDKNAEKYNTELKGSYAFTKAFYGSLVGGWLKDEFSGIDSKYYVGPACGYKILAGPKHKLTAEAGVDYVAEEYTDDTDEDFFQGKIVGKYAWAFTEKNKLTQKVKYAVDFEDGDNYQVDSETAVVCALNSSMSLKASYEVKYNNAPVPDTLDNTDTTISTTLIINY